MIAPSLLYRSPSTSYRTLRVFWRCCKVNPLQWGYEPLVQPPHILRPPSLSRGEKVSLGILENQTITLSNGHILKLGKTVYRQHGIGRGTWVLRAKLMRNVGDGELDNGEEWNRDVIVKLSWAPKSRNSEHLIIAEARNHANANGDYWVLDHLPNVLHAQDVDRTAEGPVKGLLELLRDTYEPRILRFLVLEELFPVFRLTAATDLAKVFRDVFKCYRWLYFQPGIFHRDISANNVMFRMKDGEIFGVLNDYDLALFRTSDVPTSKTRTGTRPFMAFDLLGCPDDVHRYRHDLESLFYVLVYVTSRYHEGREIDDPPLQEWDDLGEDALKSVKGSFLNRPLPKRTLLFENFVTWIVGMRAALRAGITARSGYRELLEVNKTAHDHIAFDEETLGGNLSFDTFSKILAKDI